MNGRITQVRYSNDNGMAEVVVHINGLDKPLIFGSEYDNDQVMPIYEYWMQVKESGDSFLEMLF